MSWLRARVSLVVVLSINVAWMLVALASSSTRPWGPYLWHGEESPVERGEVVLIVLYIAAWLLVAWRLRARPEDRLPRNLALAMVGQLVVMMSEELDLFHALRLPYRNLRMAARVVIPDMLDTPLVSAYLLFFVLSPLVPVGRMRSWLERAAPVRAEREDAWAAIAGIVCSVLVWVVAGDAELGELQQMVFYAVLGVITVRVVRKTGAA